MFESVSDAYSEMDLLPNSYRCLLKNGRLTSEMDVFMKKEADKHFTHRLVRIFGTLV